MSDTRQWGVRIPDSRWISDVPEDTAHDEAARSAASGAVLVSRETSDGAWADVADVNR
ncbi:MAG TPA: hypothetical protein VHX38_02935 [Pseudonocardiaceae bacterium]|jgi:hypothetical protein|nr:hypothetical protein [Pseudonocardiaceae bacterium]